MARERRHPSADRTERRLRVRPRLLALCVALALAPAARGAADLTALSLEQLLEVTIVGASKYEQRQDEVAAAVSVITRQEIRQHGWRTIDDVLASLPGVYITYDRQYSYLGTRGLGLPGDYNSRILLTINGNRINDPTYDAAPSGRLLPIDLDLVERIEFIPGPGGAVYGQNAMFGVINLVTRSGESVGAELSGAYESPQGTGEVRASWGGRLAGGTDVLLSAYGMRSQGEDRFFEYGASGVSGVAAGLDGERDQEFFASVRRGAWSFDFLYSDRKKDDPTGAYLSDPLVPGQFQADKYTLAQLQYQDRFAGNTLQATARAFYGREQFSSELSYEGSILAQPTNTQWVGGEGRLVYTGIARHTLMAGLEAQSNYDTDQFIYDLSNPGNDIALPASSARYGLYLQDEWRITDQWLATIGGRVDYNDTTGTDFSPRAALIWHATPGTTFKALYGRAFRAPNVYEAVYDDGIAQVANPNLSGERVDTIELVADHRVSRDFTLRASVYQWKLKDLVTLGVDPVSGIPQYQSGAPIDAKGVELSADKTWSNGARVRGSVSYQDTEQEGSGWLLNSPRWLGKLNASAPLPWAGLRAAYEWQYNSARLTNDGSETRSYGISNVSLVAEGGLRGLTVSLTVFNAFNEDYSHPAADSNWQNSLQQDGRSYRLKATYRF
jgi:iron complex outermembrane receptor protein